MIPSQRSDLAQGQEEETSAQVAVSDELLTSHSSIKRRAVPDINATHGKIPGKKVALHHTLEPVFIGFLTLGPKSVASASIVSKDS